MTDDADISNHLSVGELFAQAKDKRIIEDIENQNHTSFLIPQKIC